MPYTPEQLSDRQDIIDVVHAYCRAIDDNRPADVVELFVEDCRLDYGGGLPEVVGHETAFRFFRAGTDKMYARSAHFVSNCEVSFEGADRASAVSYVNAWHEFTDPDRANAWIYGRYTDVFARGEHGWRIESRQFRAMGDEAWGQPMSYIPRNPGT